MQTEQLPQYSGLHLMANLYGVQNQISLTSCEACLVLCQQAVEAAELTMVGEFFHGFEGAGVTGVVVLAESHVAIHTWPESLYVTLDVFVCNYNRDNSSRARTLFESLINHFNAIEVKRYETVRD